MVAETSERTDSRKPRRCFQLVKFQKRAVESIMAVAEPVLRSVLACGRSLRFRQGKNNLSVAFAEKRLSSHSRRSEQQASLWCTCNSGKLTK